MNSIKIEKSWKPHIGDKVVITLTLNKEKQITSKAFPMSALHQIYDLIHELAIQVNKMSKGFEE